MGLCFNLFIDFSKERPDNLVFVGAKGAQLCPFGEAETMDRNNVSTSQHQGLDKPSTVNPNLRTTPNTKPLKIVKS